jgi:class 3 adenylate cyclase/tetratricopeptide (TPR) repeat protein
MECGQPLPLRCAACGTELPPGARFCIDCGAAVAPAAQGGAGARGLTGGYAATGGHGEAGAHGGVGAHREAGAASEGSAASIMGRQPASSLRAAGGIAEASGATGSSLPASLVADRDPRSYTPHHLVDKILRHRGAMEGERKQVTVLFADVRESMALAERVDAEAWHEILDGFFQILSNGVHRFEGTINQYTGDGIMALFGAPIAHEDHAHRACYAALHLIDDLALYAEELRRRRGLNFSVRIGINSGEVVVGRIGDDLRMDYTAQGHTVGLAARVEALAAPNAVYLTEHTAALVGGYFRLHDLGEFQIKGVREPITLHRLDGVGSARSRLDVSRARGFSRFVGRAKEMAVLESALAEAKAGKMRVVGVIGEAGAGKSRLCYELAERCRAEGMPVLETHCVSHGQMIPYVPVLELLRGYFGVSELDDARVAREKIAGRLLLLDESFKDMLPLLFDFLGVPDPARPAPALEPTQRKDLLFAGLERMLRAAHTDDQPDVLIWEDLHWIDGASDTFLSELIELLEESHDLVIVNSRPGYTAEWMKQDFYTEISLAPLGAEEIDELLGDLLGPDESVRGLAKRIRQQTGGNPFFIEEVVRAFVENGSLQGHRGAYRLARAVEDVILPPTVHGVLAARIDRLSELDKRVLETSAVIGKRFAESLLLGAVGEDARDVSASLHALGEAGFVDQVQSYPEIEYAFHHPLTQEVAYRQQLAARRAETHRKVAEALEADCCASNKDAALLAHHWDGAGDVLKAVVWSKRAAEWAVSRDLPEARRHWLKVRELLGRCEDCSQALTVGMEAREALIECGWKLGRPLEEARELADEGLALAERADDTPWRARLTAAWAMAELFSGRVDEALADLDRAAEIARATSDHALKLTLHGRLAYMNLLAGRLVEAERLLDLAYEMGREAPSPAAGGTLASVLWYQGFKALPRAYRGEGRAAWVDLQNGIRAVRSAHDRASECTMHGFAVTLAWFLGDADEAMTHARAQVAMAEKLTTPTLISGAYDSLGVAHAMAQHWSEALQCAEHALRNARTSGTLLQSEAVFVGNLAAAHLGNGDVDKARALAREAVTIASKRSTPLFECRSRLVLARALLAGTEPDVDGASDQLDAALAIVERTGAAGYEPFVREERARVAALRGDDVGRAREASAAERLFRQMDAHGHLRRLRANLARAAAS